MNRRHFLTQAAGTIAAGALLPNFAAAQTGPSAPQKADGASYAP